jgi:hypothetical protein
MTTRDKLIELETTVPVDKLIVKKFGKDFQVYPWLKGRLFHKAITGKETHQKKGLMLALRQLRSVFYGWWNIFRRYDIWAFTNSSERRLVNGKYHDKLFDYVGNNSGKKTLIIELRLFSYFPYRKVASKYAISKSMFIFLEEIYSKLFLRSVKLADTKILDEINSKFESAINEKEVIRKYLAQYRFMKFWLSIFPNPKVVLMSVAYTNFGYIRAFKEKGIKVVEFQHGLITGNHHAYNYAKSLEDNQFPDLIVTIGEREVNVFGDQNLFPTKSIRPIGSYILDYYSSLGREINDSKTVLLFTLQDGEIGDKLASFIEQLIPKVSTHTELIILPRRTPSAYYLQKFPGLKERHFSSSPFYQLVLKADVHATVYSTTAVEALSLGTGNILVNIDGASNQQLGAVLSENEYTHFVDTAEEFISSMKKLESAMKDDIAQSNTINVESGYKENVAKLVDELFDERN